MNLNNYIITFLIGIVLLSTLVSSTSYNTYLTFDITEFDSYNRAYPDAERCYLTFPVGLNGSQILEGGLSFDDAPIVLSIYDSPTTSSPMYSANFYSNNEQFSGYPPNYNIVYGAHSGNLPEEPEYEYNVVCSLDHWHHPWGETYWENDFWAHCSDFFTYELGPIELDTSQEYYLELSIPYLICYRIFDGSASSWIWGLCDNSDAVMVADVVYNQLLSGGPIGQDLLSLDPLAECITNGLSPILPGTDSPVVFGDREDEGERIMFTI